MGDQPVTRAEFDGLHMAAKALLDQMVALTSKIGNINNNNRNNRNYDDKNNQNRRGEPIRVRCENNRIIEDSNSSTVEKTDFEEIMSNHWKMLQILREQTDSAKSIEKDQEAKSKVTCEDVTIDTTHGNQAMDFEKESLSDNHKDEERPATVKENNDEYCLKVSTILKEATCSSVSSTIESSISMSVAPTIRKLSQQLDSSSQFLDPDSEIDSDLVVNSGSNSLIVSDLLCSEATLKDIADHSSCLLQPPQVSAKSQSADTIDADPISEINMEIVKPTLLNKQIPFKAFSSYDLQRFGEVKFQSLSHNTIGGIAQSVLLSFDNLQCYDPGGFLVALSSCFQNRTSPSNLQCLTEVKFVSRSPNHFHVFAQSIPLSFDCLECFDPGGLIPLSFLPQISVLNLLHLQPKPPDIELKEIHVKHNSIHYRDLISFTKVFLKCHILNDSRNCFETSYVDETCMINGVRYVKSHNQIGWMWKKDECSYVLAKSSCYCDESAEGREIYFVSKVGDDVIALVCLEIMQSHRGHLKLTLELLIESSHMINYQWNFISVNMPIEFYFCALWLKNLQNRIAYSIWRIYFLIPTLGHGQHTLGYMLQHGSSSKVSLQNSLLLMYIDCEYLYWSLTTLNQLVKGDTLYKKAIMFVYLKLHCFKAMRCFKTLSNMAEQAACFEVYSAWFIYTVAFTFKMMLVNVLRRKMIERGSVHVPMVLFKWKTFPLSVLLSIMVLSKLKTFPLSVPLSIIDGAANPGKDANKQKDKTSLFQKRVTDNLLILGVDSQWVLVEVCGAALRCIGDSVARDSKNLNLLARKVLGEEPRVEPVLSSILRTILRSASMQEFIAANDVFKNLCERFDYGQAMLASMLIPTPYSINQSLQDENVNMSFGSMLLHGLTLGKMMNLESIRHTTTFFQWEPGGWCSLVHWRSQHARKALYQNENSGSSSSEVEETDVGGFLSNFIVFYFSQILVVF